MNIQDELAKDMRKAYEKAMYQAFGVPAELFESAVTSQTHAAKEMRELTVQRIRDAYLTVENKVKPFGVLVNPVDLLNLLRPVRRMGCSVSRDREHGIKRSVFIVFYNSRVVAKLYVTSLQSPGTYLQVNIADLERD